MRLLIPTGGAPHSEVALHLGVYILQTQPAGEAPTILTIIEDEKNRPKAERLLAQASELLKPAAQEVRTRVRVGHHAEEIIAEATEGNYDLIILGERLSHRLVTRLLGSTVTRVIAHAPCPVIIAKGKINPIQRILLCDSGAKSPSLLSRFTSQLARLIKGEVKVTILHVMSQMSAGPGVVGRDLRANAEELIREHALEGELLMRDIELLAEANIQAQPKVRHGFVVDEILDEARRGGYDLVAIGAHPDEGWSRFLLDNLAQQIITQIDRPVLVLR